MDTALTVKYEAIRPELDKKRQPEQDIAKGIGMLFVIFLHTVTLYTLGGRDTETSGIATICLLTLFGYAMPFFFIMSGYNWKPNGMTFGQAVWHRAKQLLIPLLCYSVVIWILMGAYLCFRGETDPLTLLKSYGAFWLTYPLAELFGLDSSRIFVAQALGPTWFIKCTFLAYVIVGAVGPYAYKKNSSLFSVILGLFGVSYVLNYLNLELPWTLETVPAAAGLMLIGTAMKKNQIFDRLYNTKTIWRIINCLVAVGILLYIQIEVTGVGMISGGRIVYKMGPTEVFITVICGTIGTVFLMNISKWIAKTKWISAFLRYLGQNSLIVLIIHGPIMRIFCDIFGITGAESGKVDLNNFIVFFLTLFCCVLAIYLKGLINKKWAQRHVAVTRYNN